MKKKHSKLVVLVRHPMRLVAPVVEGVHRRVVEVAAHKLVITWLSHVDLAGDALIEAGPGWGNTWLEGGGDTEPVTFDFWPKCSVFILGNTHSKIYIKKAHHRLQTNWCPWLVHYAPWLMTHQQQFPFHVDRSFKFACHFLWVIQIYKKISDQLKCNVNAFFI